MDFLLKASACDVTELVGSNSFGEQKNRGGFCVDLKLGSLGDGTVDKLRDQRGSTMSSPHSGSSKRTRGLNGTQNVSCLVDGCTSDLSNCRAYHRRHRVCERHSKTPVVIVGDKEQRFCQQCSRFQPLGEFDEVKRSCRRRLDGHNRRRRKLQPESLFGSFFPNHQGARLLQFSGPQACAITPGSSLTRPSIAKQHQQLHVIVQQSASSNSLAGICSGRNKQFPFLIDDPEKGNQGACEVSIPQQLLHTNASTERGRAHLKILSDKLTRLVEAKRALSLLSTHSSQTPGTSLSQMMQQDTIRLKQPVGTGFHFNGQARYSHLEDTPVGPIWVPDDSNYPCNEIFHVGPDRLLENGASQLPSFSWM